MNKTTDGNVAFLNWQPYGLIPCVVLGRFYATPMLKAVRVRVTKAQGPCLEGELYTVRDDAVTDGLDNLPDHRDDTVDALAQAESFIEGFEGDESQEPGSIAELLLIVRAAIEREQARGARDGGDPRPLLESIAVPAGTVDAARMGHAALKLARDCFRSACAERTLDRVNLALSSAKGAVRHAEGKAVRHAEGRMAARLAASALLNTKEA